jgi:hypothetical protein
VPIFTSALDSTEIAPVALSDDTAPAKPAHHLGPVHKKICAASPLVCPDCSGAMRIIAFIEEPQVVRAILTQRSLWNEPRLPPVTPGAAPREPAELEHPPWVE